MWQGMEELIKQAFMHIEVIGGHVAEGHYDLVGPNGEIILPQVWETMIEPDWSVTMHMWPIPEQKPMGPPGPHHHGMPGPPPGHNFDPRRPDSRGAHRQGGVHGMRGPPPGPSSHRGGNPPPPPPGWQPPGPGVMMPQRPPPHDRHGVGGPPIIVMNPNGPSKSSSRKKAEPAKTSLMSWMVGSKPAKSSGKGSSRYLCSSPFGTTCTDKAQVQKRLNKTHVTSCDIIPSRYLHNRRRIDVLCIRAFSAKRFG